MPRERELTFSAITPQTVADLVDFLREYGVEVEFRGHARHPMGRLEFTYTDNQLHIRILESRFPGLMAVGGIRQHVEEIRETRETRERPVYSVNREKEACASGFTVL